MLKNKTALVTGSTSGIGLAMAEALAAEGADIVLNGFGDADEIETIRQGMAEKHGVTVTYSGADLTQLDQIETMIAEAEATFGTIDILINNAGIQHVAPVHEFPVERWDTIIGLNLSSAFHTIRLALPGMLREGWGRIINTSSAHGLVASAGKAGYVAAKHGILGLTKVVALDTAGSGVTCNAICPGWVLTPLVQAQIEQRAAASGRDYETEKAELLAEKQPSGEFVTPEQVGALACFLCSDAAAQITGAPVPIDGGWIAQ